MYMYVYMYLCTRPCTCMSACTRTMSCMCTQPDMSCKATICVCTLVWHNTISMCYRVTHSHRPLLYALLGPSVSLDRSRKIALISLKWSPPLALRILVCVECSPQSELKTYWECMFWVELVSTSKPLAPPQSHIKVSYQWKIACQYPIGMLVRTLGISSCNMLSL